MIFAYVLIALGYSLLALPGCTATLSMRKACQCLLELTHQLSFTTNQCPLGFGELKNQKMQWYFWYKGTTEKSQKVWLPVYHQRPRYYLVKAKFLVPFFQNSTLGANSIDFSGVRDDKCHKSIDNGQVQSSFYDYAVIIWTLPEAQRKHGSTP